MKRLLSISLAIPLVLASTLDNASAQGQSAADAAAERARIANQRILAETERRKREAAAGDPVQPESAVPASTAAISPLPTPGPRPPEQPAAAPAAAPAEPMPKPVARPASVEPASAARDMSLVLEQLRTLGELKDAGYVTAEEFDRIKQRLLDGTL